MIRRAVGNERGSSLLVGLLLISVMSIIGMTFLFQVQREHRTVSSRIDDIQARYSAEAGCMEIINRLANPNSGSYVGPDLWGWSGEPGWGIYLGEAGGDCTGGGGCDDPDYAITPTDGRDNDGDGVTDETDERYRPVLISAKADASDRTSFSWARARFKLDPDGKILLFGDHDKKSETPPRANLSKGQPIIVILAKGGSGSDARLVEMECVKLDQMGRYVIKSRRML